jgi:hypothetical protein
VPLCQKLSVPLKAARLPTRPNRLSSYAITRVRSGNPLPTTTSGNCNFFNLSVLGLQLTCFSTMGTGEFARTCGLHFSPTTWDNLSPSAILTSLKSKGVRAGQATCYCKHISATLQGTVCHFQKCVQCAGIF